MLDEWSLASSGLVGAREVVVAAAWDHPTPYGIAGGDLSARGRESRCAAGRRGWDQVGFRRIQSNLLGGFNLNDPRIVDGDLDGAESNSVDRLCDLQERFF